MPMTLRILYRFLTEKPWQSALAVMLTALGIATSVSIVVLQHTLTQYASKQAEGIDMVVGAKGSALQNILAAVYYVDVPSGNIKLSDVDALREHPMVQAAIPLSMGDSYQGARIVGAGGDFYALYKATLHKGQLPNAEMQVALGARVAARLKLNVGDTFMGAHGIQLETEAADNEHTHAEHPFKVSAILQPTGRVIDDLIVTPLASVWRVHEGHQRGTALAGAEVTFALVQTKGPVGLVTLPRLINQTTAMQAALPSLEAARLLSAFEWVVDMVKGFAGLLIIAALAAMLGALWQTLIRREPDLALLKALGASGRKIAGYIVMEAAALSLISAALAAILVMLAIMLLQHHYAVLQSASPSYVLLIVMRATFAALCLAILATIPLLLRARSINVMRLLASR